MAARIETDPQSTHSSPSVWGPPTWTALHLLAAGYPESPTPPTSRSCQRFLRALPWMLPCESCGYHFRQFLRSYPGGSEGICASGSSFQRFLVQAHNAVRARTRPAERPWTPEEAASYYASFSRSAALQPPVEWLGGSRLIRRRPTSRGGEAEGCRCSPPETPRASEPESVQEGIANSPSGSLQRQP
jgi:hypothetical protein